MSSGELSAFREATRLNPSDRKSWYRLGVRALKAGLVEEGRRALLEVASLTPAHEIRAVHLVSDILADAGLNDAAIAVLERTLAAASTCRETRLRLARIMTSAGQAARAIELLEPYAVKGEIEETLALAQAREQAGQPEEALASALAVLWADPRHVEAHRLAARLRAATHDLAGAVESWERVVRLTHGKDATALRAYGAALSEAGKHTEAIAALERGVDATPTLAEAHMELGIGLAAAGRQREASQAFETSIRLAPECPAAHLALGVILKRRGHIAEAIAALEETTRLAPEWFMGHYELGILREAADDRAGAIAALGEAARLVPQRADIRAALARARGAQDHRVQQPNLGVRPAPKTELACIQGDLATFQLLDLLEFLRVQGKSGQLVLGATSGAGIVRLRRGRVTSAASPSTPMLDIFLRDKEALTAEAAAKALADETVERARPEQMSAKLLREALIPEAEMRALLKEHLEMALAELMTWKDGRFAFEQSETEDLPEPVIDFDLQETTLDIIRRMDEQVA